MLAMSFVNRVTVCALALAIAACASAEPTREKGRSRFEVEVVDFARTPRLELTSLAFQDTPDGPRILGSGIDEGRKLESVWIELLGSDGALAVIDPDGDGAPESSELEISGRSIEHLGSTFVFEIQGSPSLKRSVAAVAATAQDKQGIQGTRTVATLALPETKAPGQSCSLLGFDACAEGLVCAPAEDGVPHCEAIATARTKRCASAPVITRGTSWAGVVTEGPSLWEPVAGCTNAMRRGRPEAVVRVVVPDGGLALATDAATTSFDTVVSVLDGCGADAKVIACNDDDPAPSSRLTLKDLPPGEWIVIVDSLGRAGGSFELRATKP